ncbi:hypothetical protein QQF64_014270 [Cirrhinus molitorella]|uniref:DUF4939 domain-containing protein n=1 Tax=Cirrhinus molitorella TaxID=172907 RepID=A0ABR3NT00_9TELE
MPASFAGEAAECSGFLLQVKLFTQMQPQQFTSENAKAAFLISHINGKVLQWAKAIWTNNNPIIHSFDQFVVHFSEPSYNKPPELPSDLPPASPQIPLLSWPQWQLGLQYQNPCKWILTVSHKLNALVDSPLDSVYTVATQVISFATVPFDPHAPCSSGNFISSDCLRQLQPKSQRHSICHMLYPLFKENHWDVGKFVINLHPSSCSSAYFIRRKFSSWYWRTPPSASSWDAHGFNYITRNSAVTLVIGKQLKKTQKMFQQRIQQREKDVQQLREALESHKRSAQTAVEDSERIFTELIRSIERSRSELIRLIRDQEKAAVSRAEGRLERLEQEINDLRRSDAELEQLSHTQDHIQFLQSFQSLSAPPESTDGNDDPFISLFSFDGLRESVHQLRDKMEDFCKEEHKKISDREGVTSRRKQNLSGGSGGGRTSGRRRTKGVQGGDDGGRSQGDDRRVKGGSARGRNQGEDRRDLMQEEPGETQATAEMASHMGADGGRSHGGGRADDSRGPTDGGGAGGGGARGGDGEPKIWDDNKTVSKPDTSEHSG